MHFFCTTHLVFCESFCHVIGMIYVGRFKIPSATAKGDSYNRGIMTVSFIETLNVACDDDINSPSNILFTFCVGRSQRYGHS